MRKHLAALAALAAALALSAGSLAVFTARATATNVVTVGNVHATLTEPEYAARYPDGVAKVAPGSLVLKDPTVKNTGTADAWVVVTAEILDAQPQEKAGEPHTTFAQLQITPQTDFVCYDLDSWTKDNRDTTRLAFVRQTPLAPGESCAVFAPLDTAGNTLQLPFEWGNEWAREHFVVRVQASVIQSAHLSLPLALDELGFGKGG